jgi:peroxiredoxin
VDGSHASRPLPDSAGDEGDLAPEEAVMALEPGRKAPDFTLSDDAGKTVRLSDLKGKRVVLFFFPKADTPG